MKQAVIELLTKIGYAHTFNEEDYKYYYNKYRGDNRELKILTIADCLKLNYIPN